MNFASLGLSAALLRALEDNALLEPTSVQIAAIPAILAGGDVRASSHTGSGKTAAYLLPLLERLSRTPSTTPREVRALVLVPTRELAAQIAEAARSFGRHVGNPLKTCVAVGGVSINPQMLALRGGADLLIATPGRLLDLVAQNAVNLSSVLSLVLDEADRMLSAGFGEELASVIELLPVRRQNLFFSATLPARVLALAEQLLHEPTRINLGAGRTPGDAAITQRAIAVDAARRTALLKHLLKTDSWPQVLVFVESRYRADHVTAKLERAGVQVAALHGQLSQGARTVALAALKQGEIQVLVATDVAARGIHIAELPVVVNYDLPRSATDYLHRVGRTGRAGESGLAVSFVSAATEAHFRLIEKRNHLSVPLEQVAGFEPVEAATMSSDPHGGVKGRRKSKKDKLRDAAARTAAPDDR